MGTTVGLYPLENRIMGHKPVGTAVATAVVDATGTVTVTAPIPNRFYALYAEVEGAHRYLQVAESHFVPAKTWQEKVEERKAAVGA